MFGFEKVKSILGGKKVEIKSDELDLQPIENTETLEVFGEKYQYSVDFENIKTDIKNLLSTYRTIANEPEIQDAIEETVNECIVANSGTKIINLDLSTIDIQDKLKETINVEFEYLLKLMNFNYKASDIFKQWYVDGRIFGYKCFDPKKPKDGIKSISFLAPENFIPVVDRKTKLKSFIYTPTLHLNNRVFTNELFDMKKMEIPPEYIAASYSGLIDNETKLNISYLHKCIKPLNQLRLLEDSAVIYRITRAPERRVFYIDTGKMPAKKAEEYVKKLMSNFKTDIVYDIATGKVASKKSIMTMTEDFWLPTNSEGKGTKVETLPAGQNIDQIEDILLFKKKLLKSTKVPFSRMDSENNTSMIFGNSGGEMSRDEIRFTKHCNKLKTNFAEFLTDILKTQLILKNIISEEEWNKFFDNEIIYEWTKDSYFEQIKKTERLKDKIELINDIDPLVGKYFTQEYVYKEVLNMTDDEIKDLDKYKKDNPPKEDDF